MLTFCSLLLMLRGRAGLTQRELAVSIGVSERAVQVWEAGLGHPSALNLQGLIALFVRVGALSHEAEATTLWTAALEEGPRFKAAFDAGWFAGQFSPGPSSLLAARRHDWGEAPAVTAFHGRVDERNTLAQCLLSERCRLIGVVGMGGIGKTALAAKVAREMSPRFDAVFWRSLRNAPSSADLLASAILFLSEQQAIPPDTEEARRRALLDLLHDRRCLLVLDNLETVLEPGLSELRYRHGFAGYGLFLQLVGEASHKSCVLVTSREEPAELSRLEGPSGSVRMLRLGGLDEPAGEAVLAAKGLEGDHASWVALVERYRGNALALQVVGETIATVFGHNVDAFLAAGEAVFGDIRRLLESQLGRLSSTERAVLYWLAVEREPVDVNTLMADLGLDTPRHLILEALDGLRRRSLLELGDHAATVTLQPVVLEHVTEQLISSARAEIESRRPRLIVSHAFVKGQSMEYVRRSQEQLIAAPIIERLASSLRKSEIESLLFDLLNQWRGRADKDQGYGPGNVVNLLRSVRGHLRDLDLSRLLLRQTDFAAIDVHNTSLAHARLDGAHFAQQFGAAMCMSLSGDGSSLVVGTLTGEVRVWSLLDRTPGMLGHQPTGAAWDVATSADGTLVASCGGDGTVLWEPRTGKAPTVLRTDGRESWRVALSADGRVAAGGAGDGTTRLWDTRTGHCLRVLECHAGGVRGLALSADGHLLATGGPDGTLRVWDTRTGMCLNDFENVTGEARALALSSDGCVLACGDEDGVVHVWDVNRRERRSPLRRHTGPVRGTALTSDGRLLASGGADRTLRVWDTRTGRCLSVLHDHASGVISASLSADGRLAASVCQDGAVRVWDVRTSHCLVLTRGNVSAVFEVALSADGHRIVSAGGDGDVRLWDTNGAEYPRVLKGHSEGVWAVALTPDGRLAASGSMDCTVRLWNGSSGKSLTVLRGHTAPVYSVALSANGKLAASGGLDGTIRLWDTSTNECMRVQRCHVVGVRTVRLSADGHTLLTSEFDGTIRVWDATNGECRGLLRAEGSEAGRLAISADGRLVAWGDLSGRVNLWDWRTLECLGVVQAQECGLRGVGLSAEGSVLATAGIDGSVGLWSVRDKRPRGLLLGHFGEVWDVALSADANVAVSGGLDGTVRMWDTRGQGAEQRTLRPDRPYERVDITGTSGLSASQRTALLALGAVDSS